MEASESRAGRGDIFNRRVILLDGATATALRQFGHHGYRTPELLNILAPEAILDLQQAYVAAGSHAILTNTFGANRFKLALFGRGDKVAEVCHMAVVIARKAAADRAAVLGDIGPARFYARELGLTADRHIRDAYRETACALRDEGVDGFFVETMPTLEEARLAFDTVQDIAGDLPVLVSFYFRLSEGAFRTVDGVRAEDAIRIMLDRGARAAGANCCLGTDEMTAILEQVSPFRPGPLIAKPNAGLPRVQDDTVVYPETPDDFGRAAPRWVSLGAAFVGGCCGTGPDHIRAIRQALKTVLTA